MGIHLTEGRAYALLFSDDQILAEGENELQHLPTHFYQEL
jgi:hypothetical protein